MDDEWVFSCVVDRCASVKDYVFSGKQRKHRLRKSRRQRGIPVTLSNTGKCGHRA